MRYANGGINWIWYFADTKEEAIEYYKELTGTDPNYDTIIDPFIRAIPGNHDDKFSFRIHR